MVYFYRRPKNFFRIPKIVFEMVSILVGKGKSEAALRYFFVGAVCLETQKGWLRFCVRNPINFLRRRFFMVTDLRRIQVVQLMVVCLALVFSVGSAMAEKKVNINTATVEELQTLPKIGPKTAEAIVKYRKKHPFESVEDLINVKGIGEKKLELIKPHVTVGKKTNKEKESKSSKK